MVWRWCSVSLQHALPAWGPIQRYKAHNAPPRACSHTHAWNEKGHFFSAEKATRQQRNLFIRVTSCFPCACNAVCFGPAALGLRLLLFFYSSHLIRDCLTSVEGKLTNWKQSKARRSLAKKNYFCSVIYKCEETIHSSHVTLIDRICFMCS